METKKYYEALRELNAKVDCKEAEYPNLCVLFNLQVYCILLHCKSKVFLQNFSKIFFKIKVKSALTL